MIVDSQIHVWTEETPERPWIPGGRRRAHLSEALPWQKALPLMDEAGIDRAIIVPPTWPGDFNDHALEAAAAHPDRFAVMGRFPFMSLKSIKPHVLRADLDVIQFDCDCGHLLAIPALRTKDI